MSWKEFVRIHTEQLAATDFFFVPVWTLKGLAMFRVHFVIDVFTRKVKITHIGCQYSGDLIVQIGRHLTDACTPDFAFLPPLMMAFLSCPKNLTIKEKRILSGNSPSA